jgi:hypothetical protein
MGLIRPGEAKGVRGAPSAAASDENIHERAYIGPRRE